MRFQPIVTHEFFTVAIKPRQPKEQNIYQLHAIFYKDLNVGALLYNGDKLWRYLIHINDTMVTRKYLTRQLAYKSMTADLFSAFYQADYELRTFATHHIIFTPVLSNHEQYKKLKDLYSKHRRGTVEAVVETEQRVMIHQKIISGRLFSGDPSQ
jgi:hypothetical protein